MAGDTRIAAASLEDHAMTVPNELDVAIIAADADERRLLVHALHEQGFSAESAESGAVGLALLSARTPKVVLCDYELPDLNGVEFCRTLHSTPDVRTPYLIFMSADSSEALLTEALDAGADDYLSKPIGRRELGARVRVGLRMWTLQHRLRRAAITDGLTGLFNHDHINRVIDAELNRSRRYGHSLALIMMDVDHFKAINDTFGHLVGNVAVERTAQILREAVRTMDTVGRFGGDEFAIVLPQAACSDAADVAERIRKAIAQSLQVDPLHQHTVTASFGIADSNDPQATTAAALVDLADRALYLAKRRGRNQIATCHELADAPDLVATIQNEEVERLKRQLAALTVQAKDVFMQSVTSLLQALDEKDAYTARHATNVAFYAQQLAERMPCNRAVVTAAYNAGLLHDIGKVGVPDSILQKRSPLSPSERMVMDQVPVISARIVAHLRILETEVQIIRHQRESFNGTGFPAGLRGSQIPVGSRILLVADAFDAMTTDRIYRERRTVDAAVDELRRLAGTQFDPEVIDALDRTLGEERALWEARIEDTIHAIGKPGDVHSSLLAL